jgi:hypothetical protein
MRCPNAASINKQPFSPSYHRTITGSAIKSMPPPSSSSCALVISLPPLAPSRTVARKLTTHVLARRLPSHLSRPAPAAFFLPSLCFLLFSAFGGRLSPSGCFYRLVKDTASSHQTIESLSSRGVAKLSNPRGIRMPDTGRNPVPPRQPFNASGVVTGES